MKSVINRRDALFYGVLFLLVLLVASLPVLFPGIFFSGHDIGFHMQRIISIANGLRDGQFPVRIYKEVYDGYGYGAPLFYPDLFLYFPAVLSLLGFPLSYSYNVFLFCVNLATLFCAIYAFTAITGGKEVGFLGGVMYTLSAYRLIDIYTRASVGEYLALIFLPLCLCALVRLSRGETRGSWKVLALGFSGLLQSHILSFALMTVTAAVFCLCHWRAFLKKDALLAVLKAVLVTVALNLWFLVPFLQAYRMDVTAKHTGGSFLRTGAFPAQLFDIQFLSATGSDTYGRSLSESMPKTVGMPLLMGALVCLLTRLSEDDRHVSPTGEGGYLLAGGLAVLMTTTLFPWSVIMMIPVLGPFFQRFQFMWRFNTLAVLFLPIPAVRGWCRLLGKAMGKRNTLIVITLLSCVFSTMYLNSFIRQSSEYIGGREAESAIREASYMDTLYFISGSTILSRPLLESNAEDIVYSDVDRGDGEVTLRYRLIAGSSDQVHIDVPIAYYPGYVAEINGRPARTLCAESGVVRVQLPADTPEGTLRVHYRRSTAIKLADTISTVSALICLAGLAVSRLGTRKRPAGAGRNNGV